MADADTIPDGDTAIADIAGAAFIDKWQGVTASSPTMASATTMPMRW